MPAIGDFKPPYRFRSEPLLCSTALPCPAHLRQPRPRQALRGDGGYPMAHLPPRYPTLIRRIVHPLSGQNPKSYPAAIRAESSEKADTSPVKGVLQFPFSPICQNLINLSGLGPNSIRDETGRVRPNTAKIDTTDFARQHSR